MTGTTLRQRLAEAGETLARRLETEAARVGRGPGRVIARVETALPDVAPLAWLRAQTGGPRIYWRDRDGRFETAGIGAAAQASGGASFAAAVEEASAWLAGSDRTVRVFGGRSFAEAAPEDPRWEPFGAAWLVAPAVELTTTPEGVRLAAQCRVTPDGAALASTQAVLDAMAAPGPAPVFAAPGVAAREDRPGPEAWRAMVEETLALFDEDDVQKLVLARESLLSLGERPDPVDLAAQLFERTTSAYGFFFEPAPGTAFLGASPERLYSRTGDRLLSEAVAGTRRRGGDPTEDAALGEALLASEKERREHQLVVDAIRRALRGLSESVGVGEEVELLRLRHVQHLYCPVTAILRPGVGEPALVEALHPTPAVGGQPRALALPRVAALEPFDRGWYAAPVGWFGRDEAEFAVAIRSGLLHGDGLSLYTGAGIVAGSRPEREWEELESKMAGFLRLLSAAP